MNYWQTPDQLRSCGESLSSHLLQSLGAAISSEAGEEWGAVLYPPSAEKARLALNQNA